MYPSLHSLGALPKPSFAATYKLFSHSPRLALKNQHKKEYVKPSIEPMDWLFFSVNQVKTIVFLPSGYLT